jgi:predicted O-methyltransferase YrrM
MRKLIECRQQKALHHQLMKAAERSMLSIDAIVMLYHRAKVSAGNILEVGSYVGGASISMARGMRDSGTEKKIISIEREVPERPASALQGNFAAFRYFRPASLRKVHGSRSK